MGLFGKSKDEHQGEQSAAAGHEAPTGECPHVALTPRWDSLEDMGKEDRATYVCDSCHGTFSHDEAQQKSHEALERMRQEVA